MLFNDIISDIFMYFYFHVFLLLTYIRKYISTESSSITLCDTNFRSQSRQNDSYKFFIVKNESVIWVILDQKILKNIIFATLSPCF